MRVLESALKPALKPVAVVAALFGDENGERIFPSVGRLAWLIGITPRSTQRQLAELRRMRILVAQSPCVGGVGRTVEYHLNVAALPSRSTWKPRRGRHPYKKNPDARVAVVREPSTENPDASVAKRVTSMTQTLTPASPNPDASVTRSFSDPSVEREKKKSTGANAPVSPNDAEPTHAFLCVIVNEVLGQQPACNDADLSEEVKRLCVARGIDYTRPGAIPKAIDAVRTVPNRAHGDWLGSRVGAVHSGSTRGHSRGVHRGYGRSAVA
jgi:hypothetical protein